MATEGFEAATIARVVDEAGVPLSSVYHFYGSKDGLLLAVMQRGVERFFADVPDYDQRSGTAVEHLRLVIFDAVDALERHPNFLRLVIAFAVQPPQAGDGEISDVVRHVRELALKRLRRQIAIACDDNARSRVVDRVARFALARSTAPSSPPAPIGRSRSPRSSSLFPTRSSPLGERFSRRFGADGRPHRSIGELRSARARRGLSAR